MKSISRIFTVLLPKKSGKIVSGKHIAHNLRNLFFAILVVLMGILLQILVFLNGKTLLEKQNYQKKVKEYDYWSAVASQYPNIPDILYNAAIASFNAGRKNEALGFINRALQIDPLFDKAMKLKYQLEGK